MYEAPTVRGHVIRLDPAVKQANALARAAGVARFTYNWALAEWSRQYRAGDKPSAAKLKKQFNAIKGEQFPWVYESPRDANSQRVVLGEAWYACSSCGAVEDRDFNAACSLEQYPGLLGNWDREVQTPMDDHASIRLASADRASEVAEVGTKPCAPLRTS